MSNLIYSLINQILDRIDWKAAFNQVSFENTDLG